MQSQVRACILAAGEEIVKDPEMLRDPCAYILALLALKRRYDCFLKIAFSEDRELAVVMKGSFESFINKDTRTAHFLSLYVDDLFKKTLKSQGLDDGEIDQRLDEVVELFRFLQDKDVFDSYYKQQLARRLLRGSSVSHDVEKMMIARFKTECGHLYTSKMEGMLNDIRNSETLANEFRTALRTSRGDADFGRGVELRVSVLTTGVWPSMALLECELPSELKAEAGAFEGFYQRRHSGRRLSWLLHQGSGEVRARMTNGKTHELTCSSLQMVALCLFNRHDTLTYRDVLELSKIPEEELRRHFLSLFVSPKCKLLHRLPRAEDSSGGGRASSKELLEDDKFEVNPTFESKMYKLKVPLVAPSLTKVRGGGGDNSNAAADLEDGGMLGGLPESVEEDRKHLVEAAIVRIMKSRKSLEHNQLVAEVCKHLSTRFHPAPQLIKQRIEKLIDREYLARSENDRRVYNYLA